MFEDMCATQNCEKKDLDDQRYMNIWCHSNKSKLKIDEKSELFYVFDWSNTLSTFLKRIFLGEKLVLEPENDFYTVQKNKTFVVKEFGTKPLVLHAAGNSSLERILATLNIKDKNEEISNYFQYSTLNHLKKFIVYFVLLFVIIAAVLVYVVQPKKNKLKRV